jgi:hypothetical protein
MSTKIEKKIYLAFQIVTVVPQGVPSQNIRHREQLKNASHEFVGTLLAGSAKSIRQYLLNLKLY